MGELPFLLKEFYMSNQFTVYRLSIEELKNASSIINTIGFSDALKSKQKSVLYTASKFMRNNKDNDF